jgi:MSHA biogenesis protein MshJ
MKKWLSVQFARIDGLSMRERVFLFLSILACMVASVDSLWLAPAQTDHALQKQLFSKQTADLKRLRDELNDMPAPVDPSSALSVELALTNAHLEMLDRSIKELSVTSKDATPLAQVLVHFLRRYDNLTLVRTTTLTAPAASAATGAVAAVPGLIRQGLELTVAGSYAELMGMVQTLEGAMPALRWGEMRLVAGKQPTQLTLQVFVVGAQP